MFIFNFIENELKVINKNDIETINFKNEILFKIFELLENEIKNNDLNNYDIRKNKYDSTINICFFNNENDKILFLKYAKYRYNFKKVNNEINKIIKQYNFKKEKFFK